MPSKELTKKERQKRRHRPIYPKTTRISARDVITSRDLWIGVYFFVLFQVAMLLITLSTATDDPTYWIYGATAIGAFIVINGLIAAKRRQDVKFKAESVKTGRVIGVVVLVYMAIYTISVLFATFGWHIPEQPNQVSINALMAHHFIPMAFMITIVAPVIEELVFREYIPHAFGPSYVSFILSSLIFAILHAPTGLIGWLLYAVMSTGFLYLRIKGNNLFSAIAGHIVYNMLTIIFSLL